MAENLLARPTLTGTIKQKAAYRDMAFGTTARVLLIGHADGISLNDPYQVLDMQELVNLLEADTTSPLLRGALELYNAGCRDIWVMAAAPMSEYEPDVDLRNVDSFPDLLLFPSEDETFPDDQKSFYERYQDRLDVTYSVLRDYDFPEVIIPLEAPFSYTGAADFVTQLANHCYDAFVNTGAVQIGIIGTRKPSFYTHSEFVSLLAADSRIDALGSIGKFVVLAAGEGLVSIPQMSLSYKVSVATQVGANMATLPYTRGITYSKLTNIVNLDGPDYTPAQLELLTNAKVNPAVRTTKSKRGSPFQTVILTDNTLGTDGSDYWSASQMRLVARCANTIRAMGYSWIGSIDYNGFKQRVLDYLNGLVDSSVLKTYTLQIERLDDRNGKVGVTVSLTPYLGIRKVYFSVETGPGT